MKYFFLILFWLLNLDAAFAAEIPLNTEQTRLEFEGHATFHDFNGKVQAFSGHAEVDSAKPEIVTSAEILIETTRLTTFEKDRDANMFQWLHVDVNPRASFHLSKVTPTEGTPAAATQEKPATFDVTGSFTLNKKTLPLKTVAKGWREGKFLIVEGKCQVNTADYGLPEIAKGFLTVDKNVDITYHLVYDLPPSLRLASGK